MNKKVISILVPIIVVIILIPLWVLGLFDTTFFIIFFLAALVLSILFSSWGKTKEEYKINSIEFERDKEYYRNLIDKYSAAELSYVDGFGLSNPEDIVAVLLELKNKNIIKIDEKIEILTDNYENLKESEKFILRHINDGYLVLDNDLFYIMAVEKDCVNDHLIEMVSYRNRLEYIKHEALKSPLMYIFLIPFVFIPLLQILSGIFAHNSTLISIFSVLAIISVLLPILAFPVFLVLELIKYSGITQINNILLDDGKIIYDKLVGLKNYIKDFGDFKDKESESIVLWDAYLIYSVIFGLNKKIVEEYSKLIKIDYYVTPRDRALYDADKENIT